ncbi:MAG: phosphoribosyl-AMP cyclohydrolase [Pseudomonadota bacterium]
MTASALDETLEFQPRFNEAGLLPVVAQDVADGSVLMVAWANAEAIEATQKTGEAHYWSRSRQELWHKGGTSGNTQKIVEILVDCDQDTLIYRVESQGPACHTGRPTCFYRTLDGDNLAPAIG